MQRNIFFGLAVFFLVVGATGLTRAAFEGEGLTLSPPLKEITLEQGKSSEQIIRLTNPTKNLVEVYPKAMNFGAKGEGGEPTYYEKEDNDSKFSLANWITFSQPKVALTPEQVVEFKYKITVPQDAEPGGHYGVVFFATEPPKEDGASSQVAIGSMIGGLVMVKVPGQIIEKGIVDQFFSDKGLYFSNNVNLTTKINNFGNIHFKPKGNVNIKSFGGGEVDVVKFNEEGGNILPDSTRKFEDNWNKKGFLLGRYTAELAIVYGESEKPLTSKVNFWIIPWWIIVAFALLVVALVIFYIKRKRKNRKGKGGNGNGNRNGNGPTAPPSGGMPGTPTQHQVLPQGKKIIRRM